MIHIYIVSFCYNITDAYDIINIDNKIHHENKKRSETLNYLKESIDK